MTQSPSKVPFSEFVDFIHDFWNQKYFKQRFGQAFCNAFDIQDNELFYEEKFNKASDLIWNKYVKETEEGYIPKDKR